VEEMATQPEAGDSAPAVITHDAMALREHTMLLVPDHYEPTDRERKCSRVLSLLGARLRPAHWWKNLSHENKASVLLGLVVDGEWPPPESFGCVMGVDVGCEFLEEGTCEVSNRATELVNEVVAELSHPARAMLIQEFSPAQLYSMVGGRHTLALGFDGVITTGRAVATCRAIEAEHALHSYGFQTNRFEMKAIARQLVAKVMFALCVAYQIPVTEGASTSASDWVELKDEWFHFFVWFLTELRVWHTWLQIYLATYRTCIVKSACWNGDLPLPFCSWMGHVRGWQIELPLFGVYRAPQAVCGEYRDYGFQYQLAYALAMTLVCSAGLLAVVALGWASCKIAWALLTLFARVVRSIAHVHQLLRQRIEHQSSVSVVKRAVESMDGLPSVQCKPLYRMVSLASNSFDSLEMSMGGSEIRTSSVVPGCLHLAVLHEGLVTFVGMAFRYKDYLVTAQHNVFAMTSTPGKCYVIPFKASANGESSELNMDAMLELNQEMISRDIVSSNYTGFDATVIPIKPAEWSRMGVKALEHADAIWNTNVTAYGLEKTGKRKLQRSLGAIIRSEDTELTDVFYTASTLKGWSGSPILSGQRKVVALHCGTNGEHNRGLNFAYIRFFIDVHEMESLEAGDYPEGEVYLKSFRGRNGRLAKRREIFDLEGIAQDEAHARFSGLHINQASNGLIWMSREEEAQAEEVNFGERHFTWADECALTITQQEPLVVKEEVDPKPPSPRRTQLFAYATGSPFVIERNDIKLSSPFYKGRPAEHGKHIDFDEAARLGYDREAFGMPLAVDHASAVVRSKQSLSINLGTAVDVRLNYAPPSKTLIADAKSITLEWLKHNRYMTDCSGVTVAKIIAQLNSSAVGSSKSPGLPFVNEGFKTNAQLLAAVSVEELAERIYASYKDDTWCQDSINFLKMEPTKKEKLASNQDRTVQGCGLTSQIVMRCFFGELMDSSVEATRKSPVIAGWSPLKPGDGEFMYNSMSKRKHKILEYDGQHFEYTAHTEEAYAAVTDIMVGLAVPNAKMSLEGMQAWRKEATIVMDKVGRSGYQCPDGTVIKKLVALALNSGRFDTYIRNTITGAYWAVVGLLKAGYSREEIVKLGFKFGGDDVAASLPEDFDYASFIEGMRAFGMKIHKVKFSAIEEGFEFFSWHFTKGKAGVEWIPTRFSKHLENFQNTKHEFRAEALVAHMMNWVHSEPHFNFWRKCYLLSYEEGAEGFLLATLPEREDLIAHLRGDECLLRDSVSTGSFIDCAVKGEEHWL